MGYIALDVDIIASCFEAIKVVLDVALYILIHVCCTP
jgi:hypothetical protein